MRCLETRKRGGVTHRRYELEDGRRVSTVEIPLTVFKSFSRDKREQALARFARGEALRARNAKMKQRIAEGVKPEAIAHELGITREAVQQTRKKMKEANA